MNRTRRIAAIGVAAAALSAGVLAVPSAHAAPEPADVPSVNVTAAQWACLAVAGVDVGVCLDNPIPDTSGLPTVPELVDDVVGIL